LRATIAAVTIRDFLVRSIGYAGFQPTWIAEPEGFGAELVRDHYEMVHSREQAVADRGSTGCTLGSYVVTY
jgi:hypothetical protein